jgi:hypothetical protein
LRAPGDPLYRAVFYLFAKTMRAKRGHLEDGSAELGVSGETPSRIVFADTTTVLVSSGPLVPAAIRRGIQVRRERRSG